MIIFQLSCAAQNLKQDLTKQTLSNNSLIFYGSLAGNIFDTLEGAFDCPTVEMRLQALQGLQNCAQEGSVETRLIHFSCDTENPLQTTAELEQNFVNCREPGEGVQGLIGLALTWNGAELLSILTTAGFFYNGLPQSFNDFNISIDANGDAQCAGLLITDGQVCTITPNCAFCAL